MSMSGQQTLWPLHHLEPALPTAGPHVSLQRTPILPMQMPLFSQPPLQVGDLCRINIPKVNKACQASRIQHFGVQDTHTNKHDHRGDTDCSSTTSTPLPRPRLPFHDLGGYNERGIEITLQQRYKVQQSDLLPPPSIATSLNIYLAGHHIRSSYNTPRGPP
ncbi:hypothetical protein CONLIGDRAFT_649065 [Coniochaeta ligniaria NRRL 30616]|uniref:Uncharacterized protein n=1 Tax=Coniochaeta ligniaria NRRL 30616 TaxID=1408157 RepID=A0A1J7IA53_9PEZI|nr:hypothetical protein CONLIGDRAFT_649065 [Coniochaeta ligniaria NRRL 30616]